MSATEKGSEAAEKLRSLEFNERELYLLLHAVDEYARRAASEPKSEELWALQVRLSEAGACYVYPKPEGEK